MTYLALAALLFISPLGQQTTDYDVYFYPLDYSYISIDVIGLDEHTTISLDTDTDYLNVCLEMDF